MLQLCAQNPRKEVEPERIEQIVERLVQQVNEQAPRQQTPTTTTLNWWRTAPDAPADES
jgi:hypothetical protein